MILTEADLFLDKGDDSSTPQAMIYQKARARWC